MTPPRRIFVLSLCRNCEATLPSFLGMFSGIASGAGLEIRVLLGENGSTDGTRALIEHAAVDNPWLTIVDTDFMADIPERLARMAAGREAMRKSLPPARPGDAVLVLDTDLELIRPLDSTTLTAALAELDQPLTTGVCSYSLPLHYDILAFRETAQSYSPATALHLASMGPRDFLSRLLRLPGKIVGAARVSRQQRRIGVGSGKAFVSAFNGLCLYRRPLYDEVSYLAPSIDCEHVILHLAMHRKTGGMIRVSNHIGVKAPLEHVVPVLRQVLNILGRLPASLSHRKSEVR